MNLQRLLLGLVCLWALTLSMASQAACYTYGGSASLGTVSSLTLRSTPQQAMSGAGLGCDGILQALTASYIRVTLLTSDLALRDGQGNAIPMQVYGNAGYTQLLTTGTPTQLSNITLVGLGGSATGVPLYFRTQTGANVPAGTYSANISLRWDWAICTTGVLSLCDWQRSPGLTQPCGLTCGPPNNWGTGAFTTVTVSLVVTKACQINSLPNVDFGSQALVSQFQSVTQTVSVTCTATEGYTLGFGPGMHFQAPWRRLHTSGNYLRYNLYQPATSIIWNTTQTLSASGTGNAQLFNYDATIDPTQANVPAGNYSDTVLLIINY